MPLIFGIYGADFHLSEWSNTELTNILALLVQPPEVIVQGILPIDVSINEIKQVRLPNIQRAIMAINEERLKVEVINSFA